MVNTYQDLLSEKDLIFLSSICSDFIETQVPGGNNYYVRKILDIKKDLLEYHRRCSKFLPDGYRLKGLWINRVTDETNIDDDFHNDKADLTIITYINDNFCGGELEYIFKNQKIKIAPKKNHSVMFNKKIKHRVLGVTEGCRFSLISFYTKVEKIEKTLI